MAPPIQWTDEKIANGVGRFFKEFNRYPTARDFDTCSYLPTARQIQRRFSGGLPEFRTKFIPNAPTDYTKGEIRSISAKSTIERSYAYEEEFYNFLVGLFPESLIHEQKRLRPGNVSCDFFIYLTKNTGIAIDLFYSAELFNMSGIINIKLKRYLQLPKEQKIFFISILNPVLNQTKIDGLVGNRKTLLPNNIRVMEDSVFREELKSLASKHLDA